MSKTNTSVEGHNGKNQIEETQIFTTYENVVKQIRNELLENREYYTSSGIEGNITVNYSRTHHRFFMGKYDCSGGVGIDEHKKSEEYSTIHISDLSLDNFDEVYEEALDEQDLSENIKKRIWKGLVDGAIIEMEDTTDGDPYTMAAMFELDEIESGYYPSELNYNKNENSLILEKIKGMNLLPKVKNEIKAYMGVV